MAAPTRLISNLDSRMKFGVYLRSRYERLVQGGCSEQPFRIPSWVQRYFRSAYGFEYVAGIRRLVGDAQRALILGDGRGRHYLSVKLLGKKPMVVEAAVQSIVPDVVIGDAKSRLPFARATFGSVVTAEALEHLPKDFDAVTRVREVAKHGGTLVLRVPYFHGAEPCANTFPSLDRAVPASRRSNLRRYGSIRQPPCRRVKEGYTNSCSQVCQSR